MFGDWINQLEKAGKFKKEDSRNSLSGKEDVSDDSLLGSPEGKNKGSHHTKNKPKPKPERDLRFDINQSRRERSNPREVPYTGKGFRGNRGRGTWRGRGRGGDRRGRSGDRRDQFGQREGYYPVRNSQPHRRN